MSVWMWTTECAHFKTLQTKIFEKKKKFAKPFYLVHTWLRWSVGIQQENLGQKFIGTVPNSRHKLTAHVWRHKFSPVPIRSQLKKFQIMISFTRSRSRPKTGRLRNPGYDGTYELMNLTLTFVVVTENCFTRLALNTSFFLCLEAAVSHEDDECER